MQGRRMLNVFVRIAELARRDGRAEAHGHALRRDLANDVHKCGVISDNAEYQQNNG
jgi:hypothetical protein